MDAIIRQTIHVTLQKSNRSNDTLQSFVVTNFTVLLQNIANGGGGEFGSGSRKLTGNALEYVSTGGKRTGGTAADNAGAGYYVLAVLLVYSMSVVALLASHIKRKHVKILEDREIHKYLREFQVVKEKSSRDSYQNLKSAVIARLSKERGHTYRNLSRSVLPLLAVALPATGGGGGPAGSETRRGSPSGGGVWESNVTFFVGSHPPTLPTLRESNIDDEEQDTDDPSDVDGDVQREGGGGGGYRVRRKMTTKSGSLDTGTRIYNYERRARLTTRGQLRKGQSEVTIDPALLCHHSRRTSAGGLRTDAAAVRAPLNRPDCIDLQSGVTCDAFEYTPVDTADVSPMTDNRDTETISLDDDVIISINASPILPRDVTKSQNG